MSGSRLRASAAVLAVAMTAGCTHWSDDLERLADQSERIFDDGQVGYDFKVVDLGDVLANADSYKYMAIKFDALLNRRYETLFAPFFMNVKADDQVNFSAWPANAEVWTEKGRMTYVPTLYIRKDNKTVQTLLDAPPYSLFQIRATVDAEFEGYPIIYVRDIQMIEPAVYTPEALAALQSGMTALEQKRPAVAVEKLETALEGIWSRSARTMVHLKLASLYVERGDFAKAIGHYEGALENDPENAEAVAGLERAREELERRAAVETAK